MQFCAPFSHPRARYIISSIGKYRTQRKHASSTKGNFLIRSRFEISFVFFSCGAWIKEWARMVNIVQCYSESRINQVFLARGSTTSPSLSLSLRACSHECLHEEPTEEHKSIELFILVDIIYTLMREDCLSNILRVRASSAPKVYSLLIQ